MSGKCLGTTVRAVTANDYQSVNFMLPADLCCLLLNLFLFKLKASGCSENGSATLDGIRNILLLHLHNFFIQKSLIALLDSFYFNTIAECLTHHCTDRCVHTGCIATACKHSDCINVISHNSPFLSIRQLLLPFSILVIVS